MKETNNNMKIEAGKRRRGRPSKRDNLNDLIWGFIDALDDMEALKEKIDGKPVEEEPKITIELTKKDLFDILEPNTSGIFHDEESVAEEKTDYSTEEIAKLGSDDALEKWAEEQADEKCFNAQIYRSIGTIYGYYIVLPRSGDAIDHKEEEYIHHFCGVNGLGHDVWFCHNEADADMFYMDAYYKEMKGGN